MASSSIWLGAPPALTSEIGRRVERARQLLGEILRGLEAGVGAALERLPEPDVERGRQVRPEAARHRERRGRDGGERHRDALLGVPHGPARQALVGHAAERPEIGPMIDAPLALDLLGRHVRRRAEDGALPREARRLLVGLDRRVELREPEIEDLGDLLAVLALAEVDVLGLEIAVNDPDRVGLHEALGDLPDDANGRLRIDEAHARHPVVERLALEQLHGDEGPPVFEATRVVHLDDVGALHTRGRARLANEALDDDGRVRQLGREHLDGDALADVDVLRLVHRGHAAAS